MISLSLPSIHCYPESDAMKPSPSPKRPRPQGLSMFNAQAACIDVGAQFPVVAVPPEQDPELVRTFQSFTGDWHRLADSLVACRIATVAMESTGVDWIPLDEIIEALGTGFRFTPDAASALGGASGRPPGSRRLPPGPGTPKPRGIGTKGSSVSVNTHTGRDTNAGGSVIPSVG